MPKYEAVVSVGREDEREIVWAGIIEAKDPRDAEYIAARDHFSGNPHSEPVDVTLELVEEEKEKK